MKTSSDTAIPGVSVSCRASGTNWQTAAVQNWSEKILDRLVQWRERARQRRQLLELNDRLLRDIGIDRINAVREGTKPFWRD